MANSRSSRGCLSQTFAGVPYHIWGTDIHGWTFHGVCRVHTGTIDPS